MALGDTLIAALGLTPPAHVALVGGGGKSTILRALHAAGVERGWRCAAGTTTKVGADQMSAIPGFLHESRRGPKLVGLPPAAFDERFRTGTLDLLVVEADGSRRRGVKAPAAHEPVVPATCTLVITVIAADTLDRVIEDVAHRPMLVGAVCGCGPYERLTVPRAARLVSSDRGGRKGVPTGARHAVVVNRVGPRQEQLATALQSELARHGTYAVLIPWDDALAYSPAT